MRITLGRLRRLIREAAEAGDEGKVLDVPHVQQAYEFDCGASALQAVLNYYGIEVREEIVIDEAGTDEDGTPRNGIVSAAEGYGLTTDSRRMSVQDVKEYIDEDVPVILCLQAWADEDDPDWENSWENGHYVVAVGYVDDTVVFEDPSAVGRTYLRYDELKERWHDEDSRTGERHSNYGIAVFGAEPDHEREVAQHME